MTVHGYDLVEDNQTRISRALSGFLNILVRDKKPFYGILDRVEHQSIEEATLIQCSDRICSALLYLDAAFCSVVSGSKFGDRHISMARQLALAELDNPNVIRNPHEILTIAYLLENNTHEASKHATVAAESLVKRGDYLTEVMRDKTLIRAALFYILANKTAEAHSVLRSFTIQSRARKFTELVLNAKREKKPKALRNAKLRQLGELLEAVEVMTLDPFLKWGLHFSSLLPVRNEPKRQRIVCAPELTGQHGIISKIKSIVSWRNRMRQKVFYDAVSREIFDLMKEGGQIERNVVFTTVEVVIVNGKAYPVRISDLERALTQLLRKGILEERRAGVYVFKEIATRRLWNNVVQIAKANGGFVDRLSLARGLNVEIDKAEDILVKLSKHGAARKIENQGMEYFYVTSASDLSETDQLVMNMIVKIAQKGVVRRIELLAGVKLPSGGALSIEALEHSLVRLEKHGFITYNSILDEIRVRGVPPS